MESKRHNDTAVRTAIATLACTLALDVPRVLSVDRRTRGSGAEIATKEGPESPPSDVFHGIPSFVVTWQWKNDLMRGDLEYVHSAALPKRSASINNG